MGAGGDLRNTFPALEHRGPVRSAVPPNGRAHRVHHGGAPRRSRGGVTVITWMRRYRKALNVSLVLVAGGFAASLFVFGASGFRGDDRSGASVATVDGEPISTERYQRRYQAYLDAYSQMYRDRFTPELAERMGLAQQVV